MIYILTEDGAAGPVKIGKAGRGPDRRAVSDRLSHLQCATWRSLVVIAMLDGGLPEERALHLRFADSHIRGEWFARTEELDALIDLHRCEPVTVTPTPLRPAGRPRKPEPKSSDIVMRCDEVAEATGLSELKIRKLVAQKAIPYIRFSSHSVRFNRAEIAEWIAQRTVRPSKEQA